ncbi:MAG: S-methyl-5-thioribose kinase, partial [Eubacteriaceae bacterium]|nr:S-methyl-5-thioribose kinase [Eubacteriaceae bacterium]
DGNINFVFRIVDEKTGKSLIIKHSDIQVRSSKRDIGLDHNRIEAEILDIQQKLAPGLVPQVYLYDKVMCCICMEDLSDYENMRYAMIAHKIFPGFAEQISTFMANTLIKTTDNIIKPQEKRALAKNFTNPDLCEITERLVYTEPYKNTLGMNKEFEPNKEFLKRELYDDMDLHLEVAKLKEDFKSNAQSLIHGDLHTGSIMIKPGSAKVLDPEFACYAPAGYDVGNLIANLIFAWTNAKVTMEEGGAKDAFISWVEDTIIKSVDLFKEKALNILKEETTDAMAKTEGFAELYITGILADTAGVAGLELNRRVIGTAKVKDIAGIEDANKRVLAERICVLSAKDFIKNRTKAYQNGADYIKTIHDVYEKAKKL